MPSIVCCCFSITRSSVRICSDSLLPNTTRPDRPVDDPVGQLARVVEVMLLDPGMAETGVEITPLGLRYGRHYFPLSCRPIRARWFTFAACWRVRPFVEYDQPASARPRWFA